MKKALKVLMCMMTVISLFTIASASVMAKESSMIFVDGKNGNDNNPGTLNKPVQTLAKAQELARAKTNNMDEDLKVYLREGTYVLDETLVFDSRDSGQNGYNVVWSAYEDEKVTISGGTTLSEWTKVDEEKNIWKAPAKGIESRELYVNGKRAILARERAEALDDTSINKEVYIKRDNLPESFAKVEDLEVVFGRKWKWAILRVSGIKTLTDDEDYGNSFRLRYTSESKAAFKANLTGAAIENDSVAMKEAILYIQNAYELLNEPGEFYLNAEEDQVYYIPQDGEDMNNINAVLGRLENLIVFDGTADNVVKNITIQGLNFKYSTFLRPNLPDGLQTFQASAMTNPEDEWNREWIPTTGSAIYGEYLDNINIMKNRFELLANTGVHLGIATKNSSITYNEFEKLGGAGIILGGTESQHHKPEKADLTENNVVTDNYVTNVANTYKGCTGILIGYTYGTNVSYNTVTNLPYTGISVGWGWGYGENTRPDEGKTDQFVLGDFVLGKNTISYNRVENVLTEPALIDGGGIYTLGRQDGSVMTDNYVDGVHNEYGGIYLDEGSVGFDITNNVITNCVRNWLFKGDYNYIYDNYATEAKEPNRDERMPIGDVLQYRFDNNDLWDDEAVAKIKAASGVRPIVLPEEPGKDDPKDPPIVDVPDPNPEPETPNVSDNPPVNSIPKTSDNSMIGTWIIITGLSAVNLFVISKRRKNISN